MKEIQNTQQKTDYSGLIAALCFLIILAFAASYFGFSKLFDFVK